jgi:hypothetical protein
MVGPEAAGLLPNAAAKVGDGASSISRALAKQDVEASVTSQRGPLPSPSPYGRTRMIVCPLIRSVDCARASVPEHPSVLGL